jgi:hypothetical protein
MAQEETLKRDAEAGAPPRVAVWMIEDREDMSYVVRLMIEVSFPDVVIKEFRNGEAAVATLHAGAAAVPAIITVDGDLGKNQKLGPQVIEELGAELHARKASVRFVAMSGVDELNEAMRAAAEKVGQPIEVLGKGPEANAKLLALIEEVQKGVVENKITK